AAAAIERRYLLEAVVDDAGRAIVAQQPAVGIQRLLALRRAKIGFSVCHVAATDIVQHVAESVGDRWLQPARDERRDGGVTGLDLLRRGFDVLDRRRLLDAAFLEDVGAVIKD